MYLHQEMERREFMTVILDKELIEGLFEAANVPEQLKSKRKEKKMNQSDAAKYLGISKPTLASYERGEKIPSEETLRAIFHYLDLEIEEFLNEDHQNIIELRGKLQKELSIISKRIDVLEESLRNHKFLMSRINNLLQNTSFTDTSSDYNFSGIGDWVSDKVFLEEGLYIFHARLKTNERGLRLMFEVLNTSGKGVDYVTGRNNNFKGTVTIEKADYYILKVRCRIEWEFKVTKDIPVIGN